MKIISNNIIIEHKSINTQYLIWLFNQEGISELFKIFIKKENENIINNFITEYNLVKSKKNDIIDKLKQYLYNIPEIYNSPHNGILLKENKEIEELNEINEKEEDKKVKLGNKI